MNRLATFVAIPVSWATTAAAACLPPVAPPPTTEELARDFNVEFRDEFEEYFSDVTRYISCLDSERARILIEAQQTAARYDRFLKDAEGWDIDE